MTETEMYSLEAEQGVLGAILIKPSIVPHVSGLIKPGNFYK